MIAATRPRSGKRPTPTVAPAAAFPFVLKGERERREWTQREMAVFLEVSQSTVARWELGTRRPTLVELTRIGHLLNVTFHS